MNMVVASVVFVLLLILALAHFLWSIGSKWPIRDPDLLARTVVGRTGVTKVPRLVSFVVAVLLLASGIVALSLADHDYGGLALSSAGIVLAVLYLLRGGASYTQRWRARHPVEPFATLDRRNYAPLCLVIGAGFVLLVVMRLI